MEHFSLKILDNKCKVFLLLICLLQKKSGFNDFKCKNKSSGQLILSPLAVDSGRKFSMRFTVSG